jgi:hypothetical protein
VQKFNQNKFKFIHLIHSTYSIFEVLINKSMPVVQSDTVPIAGAGFNHNFETKDVSISYKGSMNAVAERVSQFF